VISRAVNNPRLENLPPGLQADMKARASSVRLDKTILAHGDLPGENVLLSPDGSIVLIDFADSVTAPPLYELAPLVFELFRCDREMILAFAGSGWQGQWLEDLLSSVAIHDFGANILLDYAKRKQIPVESVQSLDALRHIMA
jgi:thiamine kinase-like enzyme